MIIGAALGLFALAAPARAEATVDPEVVARVDARAAAEFGKDQTGGLTVGLVSGSRLYWTRSYGFADMDRKIPASADTIYRIGSITKQFTALMLWFGAEDRLPGPELDIAHYLPTAGNLPKFLIANGDADPLISPIRAQRLHDALTKAGATSTLTLLPGAGHEDPAFMATQMLPTFAFLDKAFGRY